MLELKEISLLTGKGDEEQTLLHEIAARFPQAHFGAILGPSGCGKSTLLKVIAGIREPTLGSVHWQGRNLAEEEDLAPDQIGYVPQFGIAFDFLTVWESVETALRLRVGGLSAQYRRERVEEILGNVGLAEIGDRQVRVLSGGQKRRLALALEMISSPALLLSDEVTSGLDPKAEDEIVKLMKQLSREENRIVLTVTHSLRHIDLYDSVLVLFQGHLAYHGPSEFLYHYFNVENPEDLFPRLAQRKANDWHRSWVKHRAAYYAAQTDGYQAVLRSEDEPPELPALETSKKSSTKLFEEIEEDIEGIEVEAEEDTGKVTPSAFWQFAILLARRWKIFLRDRSQMLLHLALIVGFPCLVVIFAWGGLPQIHNLRLEPQSNVIQQLKENVDFVKRASRDGSLVSGLIMFQVILLTLMGSNNSAREIASERQIFEKEKFAGVRISSYVASKACFLATLVAVQSLWMGVFVNMICHFPGDLMSQVAVLFLVNGAMTSICLGISSLMKTPEQASLVSIYLVGFQLPLSGAILALPALIGRITRPFIAAYWGWSGFWQTMRDSRFYDVIQSITQTHLSASALCIWVLCSHILLGLVLAHTGCKNSRWE